MCVSSEVCGVGSCGLFSGVECLNGHKSMPGVLWQKKIGVRPLDSGEIKFTWRLHTPKN